MEIFIPGNVSSSKNSKIKTTRGIFSSKTVMKYLRSLGIQGYSVSKKTVKEYKTKPNIFRQSFTKDFLEALKQDKPIKLGMYFIRDSKRKFDYINAAQLPLDLLTAHDFIEDDDMDNVVPVFLGYEVNKDNPGLILKIVE